MKPTQFCSGVILLLAGATTIYSQEFKLKSVVSAVNDVVSNETTATYNLGVSMGIINPEKYTIESFVRDENNTFKNLYQEYVSFNESKQMNYQEWLVLNNFGILPDTQESLLAKKVTRRSTADNMKLFINTVKKGDILISSCTTGGLLGHVAIMTSDYWVLEMKGGSRWSRGIPNNNRQLSKEEWYYEYDSDWIKVYRCPDNEVARDAAIWADRAYYNPYGGSEKVIHITYYLTDDLWEVDPSYDSKLVIQAYYFGAKGKKVVKSLSKINHVIYPVNIPSYFRKQYKLINKGEF